MGMRDLSQMLMGDELKTEDVADLGGGRSDYTQLPENLFDLLRIGVCALVGPAQVPPCLLLHLCAKYIHGGMDS